MSGYSQTFYHTLPEMLIVSLTIAILPVNAFSAWQLMDSVDVWLFRVMSITLPVIFFPYKIHVKLQVGVHSAEHVKLAVTPSSR